MATITRTMMESSLILINSTPSTHIYAHAETTWHRGLQRQRDSRRARSPSVFLARQVASLCFPAARTHRPRLLVLHRPSRPSLAPTCTERLAAGPGRGHVMICRSGGGGATSDAAVPVGETEDSRTLSPPAEGTPERPPGARRNAAAPPTASSFISS